MRDSSSHSIQSAARYWVPLLGATLAAVICVIVGVILELGPTDDAYITYRHALNFALGHGLVFNPGEPVEATSNFLFAIIIGFLVVLRIDPVNGAFLLNLASLWVIAFLLVSNARKRLGETPARPWHWIHGLLILIACPSMIYYVWVGLETVFYSALFLIGTLFFVSSSGKLRNIGLAGLFFGLAASTRMEALLTLPVAAVVLLANGGFKSALKRSLVLGAGLAIVFLPVLAFRWRFYGFPLPNTYYVKVQGATLDLTLRGLEYMGLFALMYAGLIVTAAAGVARLIYTKDSRFRASFILLMVLVQSAYVVYVGGDFFPFFRFMVPVLPLFALAFSDIACFGIRQRSRPFPFPAAAAFAIICGGVTFLHVDHISFAVSQQSSVNKRIYTGRLLRRSAPRKATLLLGAAGAIPYYSGLRSHDVFGLTDPVVAHKIVRLGKGKPGHEKVDVAGQIERFRPDLILFSARWNNKAARRKSIRRQLRFFRRLNHLLKKYKMEGEYVPMRLADWDVTAMIGAKKEIVGRLGSLFTQIGLPRIYSLLTPKFLGGAPEIVDRFYDLDLERPRYQELPPEIAPKSGYPLWQRYPPPSALDPVPVRLACHYSGFPILPCMCTHILSPFSIFAAFPHRSADTEQRGHLFETERMVDALELDGVPKIFPEEGKTSEIE